MKIDRYRLTRRENAALIAAVFITAFLYSAWLGVVTANTVAAVPEAGTPEYQAFLDEFEKQNGRPWTEGDSVLSNGHKAFWMTAFVCTELAVIMAFGLAHDLRCYALERKGPPAGRMPLETQVARAAIYAVLTAAFAAGAFLAVPRFLGIVS